MPTVPISQTDTKFLPKDEKSQLQMEQPQAVKKDDFSARMNLAASVRQEISNKGDISTDFLDSYAATHLDPNMPDSPEVWDYAALRHSAQVQHAQQAQWQQQLNVAEEGNWVAQVGETLPDASSLQHYLTSQIPVYQSHLKQARTTDKQAAYQAKDVFRNTIRRHMTRSLSNGDWQTAQQVFEQNKSSFTQAAQEEWVDKIRGSFARSQAKSLWQEALHEELGNEEKAQERALAQVAESDPSLKAAVNQEIIRLGTSARREKTAKQAAVLAQLAQANCATGQEILETQTVLDAPAMSSCREAVLHIDEEATSSQREWFVKNYFQADEQTLQKAFSKGLCNGRDYLRLQAAHLRRQSGQDASSEQWLCRGMEVWMRRQGFNEKDILHASYAVLSGADDEPGRMQRWNKIKTLLTC